MIFAQKVQLLRKTRGLSQEQLAEKMNVSRQAVSKWESAQSAPDTDKVVALSAFFGVTTDYLLIDGADGPGVANGGQINKSEKSKRLIIGIVFFCAGLIIAFGVIIAAAINVAGTDSWLTHYPSKLWFLIFEGSGMFPDSPKGLGLGPVFVTGVICAILGAAMLLWEYISSFKRSRP